MPIVAKRVPEGCCPLSTEQLVDVAMLFVQEYNAPSGIYLYSYQRLFIRRVIEAILENEGGVITYLCARQIGKSEALACVASALCLLLPALYVEFPKDPRFTQYVGGFWVGIFAPKMEQASIIYDRIRHRAEQESSQEVYSDPSFRVAVAASRGDRVSWTNGSFVIAQTASAQSNVEGKTFHVVFIDESQNISESKVNKEINPMLSSTNGLLVKIGTANSLLGNFRKSILWNLEQEKQTGRKNHFEVPYDMAIVERAKTYAITKDPKHLYYGKWVETELRRLGGNIENEEFRQNFRLLWQEAHLTAIDLDAFYDAADIDRELVESCFNKRIVGGLDFGRKRDMTILTLAEVEDDVPVVDTRAQIRPGDEAPIFYVKRFIAWFEIPGRKWHDILGMAAEACSRYSIDTLVCDATGIGDPLTEQFQSLVPGVQMIPFVMSHVGNDKVYKLYVQEIEAGRMRYVAGEATQRLPVFENFVHEHTNLLKDRVGVYTRFYAPDGEHDDFVASAALCCWASQLPRSDQRIEATSNPFYGSRGRMGRESRADRYR